MSNYISYYLWMLLEYTFIKSKYYLTVKYYLITMKMSI